MVTVKAHEPVLGVQRIVAAQYHPAGKRQRTVKPCIKYRTAIHLGIELDHIFLAKYLARRLEAEARRVGVGRYDAERHRRLTLAHDKRKDCGVVFHHIAAVAGAQMPDVAHAQLGKTGGVEMRAQGGHGQEVDGRGIEKCREVFVVSHGFSC